MPNPSLRQPQLDDAARKLLLNLERFKDPDRSGLTYTVRSGPQTYDIELK